ncbi:E3 ubiquitin-protein ligase DTX3L1 [Oncorhynchus tshawytscha]|uniref:E3 ubiquitin-protein ligase DTX3L1 n=1 Tax=Oncorhynchus tshawytscha TaxID=74940 RepID=UPI000D0A124C|nr:E3 ubiquitin-protein ligase DTX3L1 [Oncorhynchus tshawytscha]
MGAKQEKMYCTRYLDGQGPPALIDQANGDVKGSYAEVSEGSQPEGQMTWVILHRDLPGYPGDNTIQINYVFADGIQTDKHPNPGQTFLGMRTLAYLPDNRDGRRILGLLDKAFYQRLVFTVATNENGEDMVTWADIPHKTTPDAGKDSHSYPDPDYLKTARKILKDKGIE